MRLSVSSEEIGFPRIALPLGKVFSECTDCSRLPLAAGVIFPNKPWCSSSMGAQFKIVALRLRRRSISENTENGKRHSHCSRQQTELAEMSNHKCLQVYQPQRRNEHRGD